MNTSCETFRRLHAGPGPLVLVNAWDCRQRDLDTMRRMAQALDRPLNVYAGYAGAPAVDVLKAAGVRRISVGCGALQSAPGLLGRIATEAFEQGRFDTSAERVSGTVQASSVSARKRTSPNGHCGSQCM